MRISEANKILTEILTESYPTSEVSQISKIFWDDLFSIRGGVDRTLHTQEIQVFDIAFEKLSRKMPIQYVTGISYFYDLKLIVNESVLIPRPETEELVHHFISDQKWNTNPKKVLDVGTGAGCIPIMIKKKCPSFQVDAIDISLDALEVAKSNIERYEVKINLFPLDFLDESQWQTMDQYDFIISNPPYIPIDEKNKMSESTLLFEPELALFADGEGGRMFYEKLCAFGKMKLNSSGKIYMECNEFNAEKVMDMFVKAGYKDVLLSKDLQGKDRILLATLA